MVRSQPPPSSTVQVPKDELVRLLAQAARAIGCEDAASELERHQGVAMEEEDVTMLRRAIGRADWNEAERLVDQLASGAQARCAHLALRMQEFAELLLEGRAEQAVRCLRDRVAKMRPSRLPAHVSNGHSDQSHVRRTTQLDVDEAIFDASTNEGFDAKLRAMASCVALAKRKELLVDALQRARVLAPDADASTDVQRRETLARVQRALPRGIMLPDRRLESLLSDARRFAIAKCAYHNVQESDVSLLVDHVCRKEDVLPTRQVAILDGHRDEVWHVQFSHDGTKLATASKDGSACVWHLDPESRPPRAVLVHRLEGHVLPLSYVSWSPDDRWLVTAANDGRVKLWRAEDGTCVRTMQDQSEQVTSCAWMPDGSAFVSGGVDKRTCLWDMQGQILHKWEGNRVSDLCIVQAAGGSACLVRACTDKQVMVYDFETHRERAIHESEGVSSLCASRDGRHLLVHLPSSKIHLWDLAHGSAMPTSPRREFVAETSKSGRYVIRPCFGGVDDRFVVSGSEDSQIYVWNRDTGGLLDVLPGHAGTVNAVHWNPADPYVFASASDDHTVRLWGLQTHVEWDVTTWPDG
uniref:Uncharacterized protein n=1 Tax=Picocystis salinarum TaxID=88271 RepID=A0A7S3XDX8_9CHLO